MVDMVKCLMCGGLGKKGGFDCGLCDGIGDEKEWNWVLLIWFIIFEE